MAPADPLPATAGALLALLLLVSAPSCSPPPEGTVIAGSTMGTSYTVKTAAALTEGERRQLREDVEEALGAVDERMSTWREDSELSRLNRFGGDEVFPLSAQTLALLRRAEEISIASGGAFDVTVGPLVDAWGFGPEGRPVPPPEETLKELRPAIGYRLLELTPEGVHKKDPRVRADLSAIAKGYAVDQVAELLEEVGLGSYMVEVGGEVRAEGEAPGGGAWKIGIEGPTPRGRSLFRVLPLSGRAVATSGDYRNFYEVDGKRYSHAIDPQTGRPVEHAGASVSVVAADCASADGWATALLVLGPQAGYDLAVEEDLAALFLAYEEGGEVSAKATPRFTALFGDDPPR